MIKALKQPASTHAKMLSLCVLLPLLGGVDYCYCYYYLAYVKFYINMEVVELYLLFYKHYFAIVSHEVVFIYYWDYRQL